LFVTRPLGNLDNRRVARHGSAGIALRRTEVIEAIVLLLHQPGQIANGCEDFRAAYDISAFIENYQERLAIIQ
jgi:hypothetical protein